MAAATSVFLVFEGAWLEVESSLVQRRGCLRAFAREAENKWDLGPSSYELHHASGKVDSGAALQRALTDAFNGVCELEIVERLEGKMMRTMRKEMKLLEDRVMAKVETTLADVRKETQWTQTRLSGAIAPLVQCLAAEQIEMREKLAKVGAEVRCVSPLLQCVAAEQIEMREKLAQLGGEASEATCDIACTLKAAEALEQELQQECAMQAAYDMDMSNSDCLEELREEVHHLGQKDTIEADRSGPSKIAPYKDNGVSIDFKHSFGECDSRLQWTTSIPASMSYSSKLGKGPLGPAMGFEAKWHPGDKWSYVKLGDEVATPFAQSIITPQLYSKSMSSHRSCPVLPPLY